MAELVSLGLTLPTVVLALAVVYMWLPAAVKAYRSRPLTAQDWFILGVVLGFAGQTCDNIYWALPWTADYLHLDARDSLFGAGVYFNIFFRQGFGITAAVCHLRAAELSEKPGTRLVNRLLIASHIAGFAYCLALVGLNQGWL